ncbi:MAG: hypothetical protein MK101_05495 [Phycisphaerales bacterium]|nr:hypothetical protein [Phycisphaerales bacterium]
MMNRPLCISATLMGLTAPAWATSGIPETDEAGIAIEVIGSNLVALMDDEGDPIPNRTIRLVAVLPEGWRLEAVAGNPEQPLLLQPNNGTFYQNNLGGATSMFTNSGLFEFFPSLEFDSYVTIGSHAANGSPWSANNLQAVGFDFTDFASGGTISGDNGSWFITPLDEQGGQWAFADSCGSDRNGVTIAQLTLVGEGATVSFSGLLQVRDSDETTWQDFFSVFETLPDDRSPADLPRSCSGDLNGDSTVNIDDLLAMLSNWYGDRCQVDLIVDDVVDATDVISLIEQWGPCPMG